VLSQFPEKKSVKTSKGQSLRHINNFFIKNQLLDYLTPVEYVGMKFMFIIFNLNRIRGAAQKPVIFINFTFNSRNTQKSNVI
jgi:hypothetical protein